MEYFYVLVSLAAPMWLGIRRRRYYTFFVALLLLYSLLVPLNIPGQFDATGPFAFRFLLASNAVFSLWVGTFEYLSRGRTVVERVNTGLDPEILFVAFGLIFFTFLFLSGGISVVGVFERRDYGTHSPFELPLAFLSILIFGCYGAMRVRWQIATVPILVIVFLNTGGRAALVGAFAATALSVFRNMKTSKMMLLAPLAAVGAAVLYYVLRISRSLGLSGLTDTHRIAVEIHNNAIEKHGGENVIARGFLFAVDLVQQEMWQPAAETIRRLAFLYVPRSWGLQNIKAEDITYRLWDMAVDRNFFSGHPYNWYFKKLKADGGTGSIHPIVWGEGYLNLGLWSLAVYPFAAAWLLTRWDEYSMREKAVMDPRILLGVLAATYVYFVRGSASIAITYAAVSLPVLWLGCKAIHVVLGQVRARHSAPSSSSHG